MFGNDPTPIPADLVVKTTDFLEPVDKFRQFYLQNTNYQATTMAPPAAGQ